MQRGEHSRPVYNKEVKKAEIKMRRDTHSWVLLGSGRRQSWRKITKSLCVELRKFEFYLPYH